MGGSVASDAIYWATDEVIRLSAPPGEFYSQVPYMDTGLVLEFWHSRLKNLALGPSLE